MALARMRFGPFEFDPEALELRRDGAPVHLQAQPKQVLCCLVNNAGRIVSRDELRKTIWGDQTFVDFERGLNFCVSQIRSVLGDDAVRPTYIRTVAKQGYQFIATVQPEISSPQPETNAGGGIAGRRAVLLGMAALIAACTGVAAFLLHFRHTSNNIPIVAIIRFDNETGDPDKTRFTDGLTDSFVERLTSLSEGRYAVIGNAQVLRRSRDQRDLNAIAATLSANFVILGQVQQYQGQTRILVHLIRMPDQTHVSVARMDRPLTNPLDLEAEAAQRIAAQFSQRISTSPKDSSSTVVSH